MLGATTVMAFHGKENQGKGRFLATYQGSQVCRVRNCNKAIDDLTMRQTKICAREQSPVPEKDLLPGGSDHCTSTMVSNKILGRGHILQVKLRVLPQAGFYVVAVESQTLKASD